MLRDFFEFHIRRGNLHGDPTLAIERARKRAVLRTTFSPDQRNAILAGQSELRDLVALRLLLDYGLRKGALQRVQFKHFDHQRRRLTIFTKGDKIRDVPIPHARFWLDLERLLLETQAGANDYLMQRQKKHPVRFEGGRAVEWRLRQWPGEPMGAHGLHDWWYGALERAGIVAPGTTSGERMHKARHSAGQCVLDKTGNLRRSRSSSATPRFKRPAISTRTGTSTSSRRRCSRSSMTSAGKHSRRLGGNPLLIAF